MLLDEMLAREAIRHTMSIYNTEGDRGRLTELAEAFTDGGILEFSGERHVGRASIATALAGVRLGQDAAAGTGADADTTGVRPFVRHHLTTSRIELRNADEADAWTYFHVLTPIGLDHCGVYVDRFERVGESWLIAHRRVKVDWRSPDSR